MPAGKIPLALHRVQEDGITRCGEAIGLDRLQRLGRCGHRRLFVHPLWRADKSIWLRAIVLTSVMWPSLVGRNGSADRDMENQRAAIDCLGGHVLTSGGQEFRTGGVAQAGGGSRDVAHCCRNEDFRPWARDDGGRQAIRSSRQGISRYQGCAPVGHPESSARVSAAHSQSGLYDFRDRVGSGIQGAIQPDANRYRTMHASRPAAAGMDICRTPLAASRQYALHRTSYRDASGQERRQAAGSSSELSVLILHCAVKQTSSRSGCWGGGSRRQGNGAAAPALPDIVRARAPIGLGSALDLAYKPIATPPVLIDVKAQAVAALP